jgi:hypothetical protein
LVEGIELLDAFMAVELDRVNTGWPQQDGAVFGCLYEQRNLTLKREPRAVRLKSDPGTVGWAPIRGAKRRRSKV